jgi:Tol biopolymer transport system component/DNA-binding winged helix-turn-helix (wHTH) protein
MKRKCFVFSFAEIDVREREFCIVKNGEFLPVEPRAFRVLLVLLRNPQKLISKEELLDAVWGDVAVSENSLTRSIALLRKVLGDDTHEPRYIATVPTVGYRFLCDVQVSEDGFVPGPVSGITEPHAQPVPPTPVAEKFRPHPKRGPVIIAACFLCALLTLGWFANEKWRVTAPSSTVQRGLARLTFDEGLQTGSTWSPDGRTIAYSSDRGGKYQIWVQQIGGGDPIQITTGPGQNWQPDWSPDGKYIAYRSEEDGGGIYIMPALGGAGEHRKIVSYGYYPRWSPDGSRILFQSGLGFVWEKFYVVGLDGGLPREILTDLGQDHGAIFATWHPDGKRITAWTFYGNPFPIYSGATPNFSTEPVEGGPAIESRFPPELQKQIEAVEAGPGMAEWRMDFRFAWSPSGKAIFFERSFRGARNVWRMTVDPVTLQPTKVERLTTSPGLVGEFSISPDGSRLAFTGERQQIRAWAFPFDANHGHVSGPGEPITTAGVEAWSVNLSRDGKKLAFWGDRDGQIGTWERSLPNGREEPLVAGDSYFRAAPIWSPDGKRAAYNRQPTFSCEGQVVVWSSDNRNEYPVGAAEADLGIVDDWSPDGKSLLVVDCNDPAAIWQLFVDPAFSENSTARKIAADPNYGLYQPHFSPDGKWIAFVAEKTQFHRHIFTIYAMPASGGSWVRITDGQQWDDKPRWSPDGKTIYLLSDRRGFLNLWGVRFDPVKGRKEDEPFQVTSFETSTQMIPKHMPTIEFSLTNDRLVLPMAQTSGNIWILDNADR